MDDYHYKALQTLTRANFCAVRNLTREKRRFANYLFFEMLRAGARENPPTQHQRYDHRSDGTVCHRGRAGIRWPRYVDRLHLQVGPWTVCRPAATAKAVQAAAKGSYRLPKTVNDSANQAMSVIIAAIRAMESQIKTLDKTIEQQFEIISNTLTSIHGIGKVYSTGIIAEIDNIHHFKSQAFVAKHAGLVWTQHQSGDYEAENSHLIKSGNRFLRYYLLEAANSVRRCDSEFRHYYDLKFNEVNKF